MKRLMYLGAVCVLLAVTAVAMVGCATSTAYAPSGRHNQVYLDRGNFWLYLTINQVRVNPIVGTRLQIFATNGDFAFTGVTITYLVYTTPCATKPEQRMLQVNRNGRGESHACTQLFPRVVSITGMVEFWN